MSKTKEFPSNIIQKLDYYVYIYSDPQTKIPFYIGKGKGNRCFDHLFQEDGSDKTNKIKEIQGRGEDPVIEILVHGVDEETALKVEAAAIDLIGIENLTNIQKGHHSALYGRIDVDDLCRRFNREEILKDDIVENIILIRINHYYYGMSEMDLYDLTRRSWKVNLNRAKQAEYAFAVYQGLIMEVYKIVAWFPAHSTFNGLPCSKERKMADQGRYEFVAQIAEEAIRAKYIGKSVSKFYKKGEQNPIKYVLHN